MLAEHSLPGVRDQLMTLWATWVESNYADEPVAAAQSSAAAESSGVVLVVQLPEGAGDGRHAKKIELMLSLMCAKT